MVNDFRMFTAWALGVLSAVLGMTLMETAESRAWMLCLGLFIVLIFASFWRIGGMACAELVEFLQGALDARRVRRRIDEVMPRNGLIIQPSEVSGLEVVGAALSRVRYNGQSKRSNPEQHKEDGRS